MHRNIFVTTLKPGLALGHYLEHYHTTHFQLAIKMPGLVAYRQMPIQHEGPRSDEAPDYDAVSEYVFDSDEAAEASRASAEGQAIQEDTGKFIDWPSVISLPVSLAQERVRPPMCRIRFCSPSDRTRTMLPATRTRPPSLPVYRPACSPAGSGARRRTD
jgi:uncharacterized protein (TIGR02118 family)